MFTGIVDEVGKITSAQAKSLGITAGNVLQGVELGGSMAVNGVCLTITSLNASAFEVDIMPETQERTNLGLLSAGDRVNLELPLALGGQLGGHLVQGHVDATGRVVSVGWNGEAMLIRFEAPPQVMHYIVQKGFVAVDGISLTVMTKDTSSFWVSVVDYTRRHTTLDSRQVGDMVNLEVDIMAKYVEQVSQPGRIGITTEFLQEHGFL